MGTVIRGHFGGRKLQDKTPPSSEGGEDRDDEVGVLLRDSLYYHEDEEFQRFVDRASKRGDTMVTFLRDSMGIVVQDESLQLRIPSFKNTSLNDLSNLLIHSGEAQWEAQSYHYGAAFVTLHLRLQEVQGIVIDLYMNKSEE